MFNNLQKKKVMVIGQKDENNGLYHIHTKSPLMISVEIENAIKLWYKKFGYLNYKNLNHVLKENKVKCIPKLELFKSMCKSCLGDH
jgi:hypothetical protein